MGRAKRSVCERLYPASHGHLGLAESGANAAFFTSVYSVALFYFIFYNNNALLLQTKMTNKAVFTVKRKKSVLIFIVVLLLRFFRT